MVGQQRFGKFRDRARTRWQGKQRFGEFRERARTRWHGKQQFGEFGEQARASWRAKQRFYKHGTRKFDLSDTQRRVLLISKLKGSALEWMHADPSRFVKPTSELLQELQLAFGDNESKRVCGNRMKNSRYTSKRRAGWPEMSTWRRTSYWMDLLLALRRLIYARRPSYSALRIVGGCLELSLT